MPTVSLESIIKTLKHRTTWPVALRVLAQAGIPAGRGWDATISKLANSKGMEEQTNSLYNIFRENLVSGEKSLRLYRQSSSGKTEFIKWLMQQKTSLSEASSVYLLDDDHIQALPVSEPKLISVEPFDDGVAGIFSSIRVQEVKEEVDPSTVSTSDGRSLNRFKEIVGIRIEKRQLFDVVWAPHRGNYLDVRIDNPPGTTIEEETGAHQALKTKVERTLNLKLFNNPVNLFPLIDKMYRDKTEGTVVELGFATSTGSVKNEKMRRSHQCLRKEIYHVAGSAALKGEIEPFRLSIRWALEYGQKEEPNSFVSHPELALNGNTRMLHSKNPVIYDAVIRDCTGLADFEYVRARLEAQLDALRQP